jgi:hypothetical protein
MSSCLPGGNFSKKLSRIIVKVYENEAKLTLAYLSNVFI